MTTYAALLVLSGVVLNALAQLLLKMATNKVGVIEASSALSLGARAAQPWDKLESIFEERVAKALAHLGAPSAADMAALQPAAATLVDLGAGNCAKAAGLFEAFAPARYVAVDISVDFLRHALSCLQRQYPDLPMAGLGLDFSLGLTLPTAPDCTISRAFCRSCSLTRTPVGPSRRKMRAASSWCSMASAESYS